MTKIVYLILISVLAGSAAAASHDAPKPSNEAIERQIEQLRQQRQEDERNRKEQIENMRGYDSCGSDSCREVFKGRIRATEDNYRDVY